MIKQEQKFQIYFNHWLKSVFLPKKKFGAFAFELKHTRSKNYLSFSDLQDHQIASLQAVCDSSNGFTYKISDETRGYKPFDCFAMKSCPAYVVIKYPDLFVLIDINTFVLEKNTSKRKSLTLIRAKELAYLIVHM